MERIRKDPALWESLFSYDLRRELALSLTDSAAALPFVRQILAADLELEEAGANISSLFIIVDNRITQHEIDQLEGAYNDVCLDDASREVLGYIVVIKAGDFLKKRFDSFFRYKETTIVYEREKAPTPVLDRLNLNCYLN